MMFKTHLAFGVLVGLLVMPFVYTPNKYIYFAVVLFGSLFVDIDHPNSKVGNKIQSVSKSFSAFFGHRGFIHSIWFALIASGLIWYFISKPYGVALFIGMFSHLLIDGLTKEGVNLLNPISRLHISGFVETGKSLETITFAIIIVLIAMQIIHAV